MKLARFVALTFMLALAVPLPSQSRTTATAFAGKVRVYFIAADEVDWTYIPLRADNAIHGRKDDFSKEPGAKGEIDPNATTYLKAVFREYTDDTFKTLKPRTSDWQHLGALGPLIRAEVGDSIRIVFRNHASRPYSVHPHGFLYRFTVLAR